jgi:glyoxylase-like metal-dependent hydrolase (beta-lactamase superfamily II)
MSVLSGSGGNIVVLTGPDGTLLVDAGIAVSRARIQAALDQISDGPIKCLINTHWHWDHTDGNEWIQNLGATIIAHENVLKRLSGTTRVEDWNYTFQLWPTGGRLKKQGKSNEEVVAAKPTADYDDKWGGYVINGAFFTRLVYAGV